MGKNLRGYLAFAIVGGFVAYTIFGKSGIDVDVQAYQMQINLLEQKIDSIQTENTLLVKEGGILVMSEDTDVFAESIEYLVDLLHEMVDAGNYGGAELVAQRIRELQEV